MGIGNIKPRPRHHDFCRRSMLNNDEHFHTVEPACVIAFLVGIVCVVLLIVVLIVR